MEKKYYFWKDNGIIWKENKIFFDKKIKKEYNTDSYSENEKEIRSLKKKQQNLWYIYIFFLKKIEGLTKASHLPSGPKALNTI